MLLVNDDLRRHGPFTKEKVLQMLDEDEEVDPVGYEVQQSDRIVRGDLVPNTPNTILATCEPCIGSADSGLCRGKSEWGESVLRSTGLPHLGYLHLHEGKCVGGAEFLPSEAVQYPIDDKRKGDAFLTCSYM